MSDTEEYVQPPINVPFTTPMVLASDPPEKEESTFESTPDGLREAANEIVEAPTKPDVITIRDVQTGKPRPSNETLSAEQAGKELARYRGEIADQKGLPAIWDMSGTNVIDAAVVNHPNPGADWHII